jgi:cysteine dioxygenase
LNFEQYIMNTLITTLQTGMAIDKLSASDINIDIDSIHNFINYNATNYTRNLVHVDRKNDFSIYIMCWMPNQQSGIHDHPEHGCMMKVLKGQVEEILYTDPSNIKDTKNISEGQCGYIQGQDLHNVINKEAPSVTLHIYSPAFHDTKFYK